MKNLRPAILAILACSLILSLPSCSKGDDGNGNEYEEIEQTDDFIGYVPHRTEYCVLFYGVGGGNLDSFILSHIQEGISQRSSDRVQMAMQFKFSYYLQQVPFYPEWSNTCRLMVTGKDDENGYLKKKVADEDYDMGTGAALESFLRWAMQTCPADHYILSLWGHGNGWNPAFDNSTKAVVFDDNTGTYLRLDDLVGALKASGMPLDALILDSCAMGMAEIYAALSGIARYAISTPSISSGSTGNFQTLMQFLESSGAYSEGGLRQALEMYVDKSIKDMKFQSERCDLSVTDLDDMDRLTDIIRDLTDCLVDAYEDQGTAINKAVAGTIRLVKDDGFFPLDLGNLVDNLAANLPDSPFEGIRQRLAAFKKDSFHSARTQALEEAGLELFLSITLMDHSSYYNFRYDDSYPLLELDKKTRWSRFLEINTQDTDHNGFLYDES